MIDNAGDNNLATPCPLSVIPLVKRVLSPNVNVNQVWRELQKYDLVNVIESVKNRLLDFLLELDKEMKLDANFMAQGGLSVADGCRCLTKELDMIAC